ncbi:MAG: hypothetical protein U5L96_05385 [Owenweeksia sp.]|nr:hypothetical protein [Owenweeksia sp.]
MNNPVDTVVDSAIFVPTGLRVVAGNQMAVADSVIAPDSVSLSGDGSGFFNPLTGEFRVAFNQPVVNDVNAQVAVTYPAGALIRLESATSGIILYDSVASAMSPNESRSIQDPVQSMFFIGLRSRLVSKISGNYVRNHIGGIWMTREVLSSLERTPEWLHIANLENNEVPTVMKPSSDGDVLYVGTSRIILPHNLANARDSPCGY